MATTTMRRTAAARYYDTETDTDADAGAISIPLARPPPASSALSTAPTLSSLLPTYTLPSSSSFAPTSALRIHALGKSCFSLPLPPAQLAIPIYSADGARQVYVSVRAARCSGSCGLVRAGGESLDDHPSENKNENWKNNGDDDGDGGVLAHTTYRFGPGRDPRVRLPSGETIELSCTGLLTRAVGFATQAGGRFEWRYAGRRERDATGDRLLVLEQVRGTGERRRVAQLVRGVTWRTAGTRKSTAGNGGLLLMALEDEGSGGEDGAGIDEVLVVVTCLAMLKKEIDRLRALQFIALSTAAGGGGL